ncbi:MAG: ABC transporter ATP-binding protein [Firmicutes bacterium]|nr:ABC transporter ATP-binding protein [Bacillota bacterium]
MRELRALWRFVKSYRWWLVLAVLCMVLVTITSMAGPWMIRNLIKMVTEGQPGDLGRVDLLALLVIIVYSLRAIFQFGTNYVSHYAAWNIVREVRQHLYDHLQTLSLRYFQEKQTGELMSTVINDTRNFEQLLAHAIPTMVVNVLMLAGIGAILFTMNHRLAFYTMIPVPALAWMVLKFSKVSRPLFREAQGELAEANAILQDNFAGITEIKAFTREAEASARTRAAIAAHTRAILRALKLSNAFRPGIEFIASTGTVIVIFFGGRLALQDLLPIEDLVAFLLYLSLFYEPITALGRINEGLQHALASAERVLEILAMEPEIADGPDAVELESVEGSIEFREVNFGYNKNMPVLKGISFRVEPGETLALVGTTGVGKTTLARLIPRFYDPDSGEILIDGLDIRKIRLQSLRKHISVVSQDVFLFTGTVRENIIFGRPDAADEEIVAAAKAANAHDFILELPRGYETEVGERGAKLSGGQKQRISIARAVLKDAPILLLDEATSSVDTQTEILIQEALDRLKTNKTTIMIAHRLSTIQNADKILVLMDGKVAEAGSHDELLQAGGLYSRLHLAQGKPSSRLQAAP